MSEQKVTPTQMRAEVIRLHRAGKMPSLDELLRICSSTKLLWSNDLAIRPVRFLLFGDTF